MRDVIESVNGRATRNLDDLVRVLGEYKVGDEVTVGVRRASKRLEVRVRLVDQDEAAALLP
jgi:S1-C subfamily serine protease